MVEYSFPSGLELGPNLGATELVKLVAAADKAQLSVGARISELKTRNVETEK